MSRKLFILYFTLSVTFLKSFFVSLFFSLVGPTKKSDFEDLLSSQGFTHKKDDNRTINEIKKKDLVREMDPDKLKVKLDSLKEKRFGAGFTKR